MSIMAIIYLYVLFIVLAFLADRLPFLIAVKDITVLGKSSFQTIRSTVIDDSQKEKLLLANSRGIFILSCKLIAFIVLIAGAGLVLLLAVLIWGRITYWGMLNYVVTFNGLVLSAASFITYYLLKKLYVKIRL